MSLSSYVDELFASAEAGPSSRPYDPELEKSWQAVVTEYEDQESVDVSDRANSYPWSHLLTVSQKRRVSSGLVSQRVAKDSLAKFAGWAP